MKLPKLSLLSSFSQRGYFDFVAHHGGEWPRFGDQVSDVELYAFMQGDLDHLKLDPNRKGILCLAQQPPKAVTTIAETLRNATPNVNFIGLASFVPEIMAPEMLSDTWRDAQKALIFLVELAAELCNKDGGQVFLELVAGCGFENCIRFSGGKLKSPTCMPKVKAIELLLERLKPVAEVAKMKGVVLAIEMEPGPLFTIGGYSDLWRLCKLIETHSNEAIRNWVGINLDMAHWDFLAKIQPQYIDPSVMCRIVHAHISDHSKGHFCDLQPGWINGSSSFNKWIDQITLRASTEGPFPYSGFISLELECCETKFLINKSISYLKNLRPTLVHETSILSDGVPVQIPPPKSTF